MEPETPAPNTTTRRQFIQRTTLAAVAVPTVGIVSGCSEPAKRSLPFDDPHAQHDSTTATTAPPTSAKSAREKADEMDAMHEKGVKAFPAKTAGKGNQVMKPKLVAGVKVFELTAREIQWEVESGKLVKAWAFNDQVPGPQIRVTEGDRVRIVVDNQLPESTAVHFHGLEVPNDQDGVPFITQPPIKPGTSFTYEFTVPNSGSHMYHSHHNAANQTTLGLLGAFIVEPREPSAVERADVDYVMVLNDGPHGYTLNGKRFPATEPIVVNRGQRLRLRFMNEGFMIHPMHLHGMHMTVIAKDGWLQPAPWKCDTLNVAPGERWDCIVNCNNPGTWAFHCHILTHAESPHGMVGMVTALVVK